MGFPVYELDTKGDIILIVQSRVWAGTRRPHKLQYVSQARSSHSADCLGMDELLQNICNTEGISVKNGGKSPSMADTKEGGLSETLAVGDVASGVSPTALEVARIRVLSKYLTLASPYFSELLQNCWQKGNDFHIPSSIDFPAEYCDLETLLIVMKIVHGRHWALPARLELVQLTCFVVLVNYYGCFEIAHMFANNWITLLEPMVPLTLSVDALMWLCVLSVFQRHEIFQKVAAIIQYHSEGRLSSWNWPISGALGMNCASKPYEQCESNHALIEDAIEQQRQSIITNAMRSIYTLLHDLICGRKCCESSCNATLCGGLLIGLQQRSLLPPNFAAPFSGRSLKSLLEDLKSIEAPALYTNKDSKCQHGCSLQRDIRPMCYKVLCDLASLNSPFPGL